MNREVKTVAVIGAGIAGISSAHYLSKKYQVTLFEKNSVIGGHTNTFVLTNTADAGLGIDTGFIVLNDQTYPNLHKFLAELKVPVRWSDMSFSYFSMKDNFAYSGAGLKGLFAEKKNIFNPKFYFFLSEIRRFCQLAIRDLEENNIGDISLAEYLAKHLFKADLIDRYILPMGAAIWSTAADVMLSFPAKTFLNFFKNHGLLKLKDRPRWQTVVGGSHSYLKAFHNSFNGELICDAKIKSIEKRENLNTLHFESGEKRDFDAVVMAVHADQVLKLLANPSSEEKQYFSAWSYNKNYTVLHTDTNMLHKNRAIWAAWNYREDQQSKLSVTYQMNRLQGLNTEQQYLVSLNCDGIDADKILYEIDYQHPLYTLDSIATQQRIQELNGQNNIFYAGSYLGYGFHEDGIKSGINVAKKLGVTA
jgi:predicted NAD/FAD-binding protein